MPDIYPGAGHNSGACVAPDIDLLIDPEILTEQWAADHAAGLERRDALLARVDRFREENPAGVTTEAEAEFASDLAAQIASAATPAATLHEIKKAPFLAAGRAADAFFMHGWSARLQAAVGYFTGNGAKGQPLGVLTKYQREKAETERLLREEAAKQAAEEAAQAAAAAAAAKSADLDDNALHQAEMAELAGAAARAPVADLSRTRGPYGSTTSLRANWTWEGVDLMELVKAVAEGRAPLNYLTYNVPVIGGAVRPKDGVREIPGIKIWNASSSQVRK